MLSSSAVDGVWGYRLKPAAKLIGRGLVKADHQVVGPCGSNVKTPSRSASGVKATSRSTEAAVLEPLRQAEFCEQRGVEKGHDPRHPVGPQVQHM